MEISDVSHSTAFLTLDNLVDRKKILVERADYLKEQYKKVHDRVLTIYQNDNFLLRKAKVIRKELDNEKGRVEKCAERAKEDDATIQKLKRELALAENELHTAQEKESLLQVETIEQKRKQHQLQNEVDDAIAQEESRMRPTIDALTTEISSLKDEIEHTAKRFDELKVDRESLVKQEGGLDEAMRAQDMIIYERRLEHTKLEREPERAKKQADIVERATQTAEKEHKTLGEKLRLHNSTITEHDQRRKTMESHRYELALTLETQRTAIEQREKTMHTIAQNLEGEKETNFKLQQQTAQHETKLKQLSIGFNREKDALNKMMKEKDGALKEHRRLEQALRDARHDTSSLDKQQEILIRELQQLKQKRTRLHLEMEELKRDVDVLINNYLKEEKVESQGRDELNGLMGQIKEMERTITAKAEEEQMNARVISELSISRENKSREASKNKAKVLSAQDELKVKEVVVKELQKRNSELLQRLSQLTEMYSVVKRERSNKAALIQSASQAMSETQEKIKILDNELEVLRRESGAKDKALGKVRRELHDERTNSENLRIEANKLYANCKVKKREITEQCSQITKLNTVISSIEEDMLQLKRRYERAVEDRNFTGIQLIDRNDELCILYEKANVQENLLKGGQKELSAREEQIRAMSVQLKDLQREIVIMQKKLPELEDTQDQLEEIETQIAEQALHAQTLEDDLVDPKNPERWRKLGGVKKGGGEDDAESGEVLQHREQDLENKLNKKHEKYIEVEFNLQELDDLTSKLRKQAVGGREVTLAIAKKVNAYQHALTQKTNKTMAVLSELSMVQAEAYRYQKEIKDAKGLLEEARNRQGRGEAPSADMEAEFYRIERDKARRREQLQATQVERDQIANMPNQLTRTTAVARPTAYREDVGLGLAIPYGKFPPVKPSLPITRPIPVPSQQPVEI